MISINIKQLKLNDSKMRQIAEAASSQNLKIVLKTQGEKLLQNSFKYIPYNIRSSSKHMRDKYYVTNPSKSSFKIEGRRYPSCQVKIKPKGKFQIYYAVVTAGVKNDKKLNYSLSTAKPYPLESTYETMRDQIEGQILNALVKEINHIDKK